MAMPARRMVLGLRPGPMGEGAREADALGIDFVFLDAAPENGPVGRDALSVAACLMSLTRGMGLVAAVSTAWQPFNVARALASFDLLARGRCGWMPVPLVGETAESPRYAEHLAVVAKLFESWDDDALRLDKAASVFADPGKVRRIRHDGAYFTVDGPLNAPRPPQGHPVLFQPAGAGLQADVTLLPHAAARPASASGLVLMETGGEVSPEALQASFDAGVCDGFLIGGEIVAALALVAALAAGRFASSGDLRTRLGLGRLPMHRDIAA